jgi:hypothetical protein
MPYFEHGRACSALLHKIPSKMVAENFRGSGIKGCGFKGCGFKGCGIKRQSAP